MDLAEVIRSSALAALRDAGRETLRLSRRRAQEISPRLAASGSGRETRDGFEVRYSAPYAAAVELGARPGVVRVRAHVRRVRGRPVRVRAYSYRSAGRPGARFVGASADEAMSRIARLVAGRIERELWSWSR